MIHWIKKFPKQVLAILVLSVMTSGLIGINSSSAFFFFSNNKLKWDRYDFKDKTQEEQADVVEEIISSAIPDSIVAKLQNVEINQCTLVIETKYLRPCKTKFDIGTTIYSRKIVDLTELSDNISYDVMISQPSEYSSYPFIYWKYKPDLTNPLIRFNSKLSQMREKRIVLELKNTGQSIGSEERVAEYSKLREEELNRLGMRSRTVDTSCSLGDRIRYLSSSLSIRTELSQDDTVISALATYKLNYCTAKIK